MKLEGAWLVAIVLSFGILALGELEQFNSLLFIGAIGFILASLCEISSLSLNFIKKQNKR